MDPFVFAQTNMSPILGFHVHQPLSPASPTICEVLADWKLCDIGVYFERFQQFQTASFANSRGEYAAMFAIREFVLSIQYFKGQDPSKFVLDLDW